MPSTRARVSACAGLACCLWTLVDVCMSEQVSLIETEAMLAEPFRATTSHGEPSRTFFLPDLQLLLLVVGSPLLALLVFIPLRGRLQLPPLDPADWLRKSIGYIMRRGPVPKHVAFIMDGNRRWAKNRVRQPRTFATAGWRLISVAGKRVNEGSSVWLRQDDTGILEPIASYNARFSQGFCCCRFWNTAKNLESK
jgi:hypothetical protein